MNVHPLSEMRVAVIVRRIDERSKKYEIIPDSVCFIEKSTPFDERPEAVIVDEENNVVEPTGKFLWSSETIDPYHIVTDVF